MTASDDKFYHARITKRVDFAPDLWMIRIDPGAKFAFVPGQYATLGVTEAQKRFERPYSIVSSPNEDELEFFFELVPHGDLTPELHKLQLGDQLLMRKVAKGRFTLDTGSGRGNHLFVCTVTGIAPFVSYIRTLRREWEEGRFTGDHRFFLLYGASRSWEFGYHSEMEEHARQVSWLKAVATVSRPWEDEEWDRETGRVEDVLRKYADTWELNGENCVAYLCGNPGMIERCREILKRCGYPKEALKEEIYWVPEKKAAA